MLWKVKLITDLILRAEDLNQLGERKESIRREIAKFPFVVKAEFTELCCEDLSGASAVFKCLKLFQEIYPDKFYSWGRKSIKVKDLFRLAESLKKGERGG